MVDDKTRIIIYYTVWKEMLQNTRQKVAQNELATRCDRLTDAVYDSRVDVDAFPDIILVYGKLAQFAALAKS